MASESTSVWICSIPRGLWIIDHLEFTIKNGMEAKYVIIKIMFTIVVLLTFIAIIKNNIIILYIYKYTLVRNHGNPAVIKHSMLENDT